MSVFALKDMIVRRPDSALYIVEDLEEGICFYRDVLGHELSLKTENYAELNTGNSAIAL
ncbi:MAG: VOC family protein [Candidatus Geothermarchaeales archaeon]